MTRPLLLLTCLFLSLPALPLMAQDTQPFSKVTDVCPTCAKPAQDVLTLGDGTELQARVVAENDDFFVVERHGEVRSVSKSSGMRVAWANSREPVGLSSQDQIVLNNGHILTGSLVEEKDKPALYRLQSSLNTQTYIVFKDQVRSLYKGGKRVELAS